MLCERCSKSAYKIEKCNYCNRLLCVACTKSSKRVKKIHRYAICKDCWGDMKKRTEFKAL